MLHAPSSAPTHRTTPQNSKTAHAGARLRRPAQAIAALSILPSLAAACSEVKTPAGNVVGMWASDTTAKSISDFNTAKLVDLLVANCASHSTQLNTGCNYLVGANQIQKAVNGSLQASLFLSPFNQSAEPNFLACSLPQLTQWLASSDALSQGSSGNKGLSGSAIFGIVIVAIVGSVMAGVVVSCCCEPAMHYRRARNNRRQAREYALQNAQRGNTAVHPSPSPAPLAAPHVPGAPARTYTRPSVVKADDTSAYLGASAIGAYSGAAVYGHGGGHHSGGWGGGYDGGSSGGGGFGGGDGGGGGF